MINSKSFYEFLLKNKIITNIWKYVLDIIEEQLMYHPNKDSYLTIFTIYFSLINDGNVCMSLDESKLKDKWLNKIQDTKVLMQDKEDYSEDEFNEYNEYVKACIDNCLRLINDESLPEIIGNKKLFKIDSGYIYLKKYYNARNSILESIKRLFVKRTNNSTSSYTDFVDASYPTKGQIEAFEKGLDRNLFITGGPGTGKTTSIIFLLISLLKNAKEDLNIYLVAPGGKASKRMKQSIDNGLNKIKEEFRKNNTEIFQKIIDVKPSTIHSLLEIDSQTNGFSYNKNHQFPKNSLFVIDEASMIDICLFSSLLSAIPTGAYVYILGDKNQLPSVESGEVFGDLLENEYLKDYVVTLDESKRFKKGSTIYNLAAAVNEGLDLPINESDWKPYNDFVIEKVSSAYPVYLYNIFDEKTKSKEIIESVTKKWADHFYSELQDLATNINKDDIKRMKDLSDLSEYSKILCVENKGPRGVQEINKFIKNNVIDFTKHTSIRGYYPGMIMMISKNNKMLDLFNGDSGILVTFENDDTLYFMIDESKRKEDSYGKVDDEIFMIDNFKFYPFRLISTDEIDMAYAITIHKSQGSDYQNILIIIPDIPGHPLLNRKIIYTAVTRTSGNTYILATHERLLEASKRDSSRDTNLK